MTVTWLMNFLVGQNPFESRVSGNVEYAPIVASIIGPKGSFLTLHLILIVANTDPMFSQGLMQYSYQLHKQLSIKLDGRLRYRQAETSFRWIKTPDTRVCQPFR